MRCSGGVHSMTRLCPAFAVTPSWEDGEMETVVLAERLSALDVGEGGGCGPEVLAELVAITFDHVAVFARLLPASASDHRRACLVRDEAELVAAAKSESATVFSGRCVSWRQLVDTDVPVDERLGREEHGMTVNELDARSSELTLRASTEEIEQVRSAINQLADQAWRAEGCTSHESEEADGNEATEAGEACGEPDAVGGDPCTKRRHPRRGRLQAQAAVELAARACRARPAGWRGRWSWW